MLAGLPALVTQNCGYARYLEEAGAGLLAPLPFEQTGFNDQLVELFWRTRRLTTWSVSPGSGAPSSALPCSSTFPSAACSGIS
jgi:hypothetical protein